MTKITYRRLHNRFVDTPVQVMSDRGITTFDDHLAYMCFVRGLSALRGEGVDVSLIDAEGYLIVGDFADPANKVPFRELPLEEKKARSSRSQRI